MTLMSGGGANDSVLSLSLSARLALRSDRDDSLVFGARAQQNSMQANERRQHLVVLTKL